MNTVHKLGTPVLRTEWTAFAKVTQVKINHIMLQAFKRTILDTQFD